MYKIDDYKNQFSLFAKNMATLETENLKALLKYKTILEQLEKQYSNTHTEQLNELKTMLVLVASKTKLIKDKEQKLSSAIKEFNSLTETANATAIKFAVQGLYSQYNNAMGVEPNLVSGRASSSGPTPYRSTAEVVTAMSDPRYGKDVTYTEDVQRRIGGSDVFNTGR